MLKLKHLFENFELAKLALQSYDHDEAGLDDMLSRFRISSNAIYPYRAGGEVRFLRLAPTDEKLERNVRGELEFIEYLRANGYPAMKPVRSRSGETVLTLHTEWGDYYASSFDCVPGVQIEDTDYSGEILTEYGKALARLHNLSERYVPLTRKWSYSDALDWVGTVLDEYGAPDAARKELERVRAELSRLPRTPRNFGLLHYDFEPDNVFWDAASGSCYAIDFDDGMYGWYALDIDQALDELPDDVPGAAEKFLAGYRSERAFTDADAGTLPLMRRFCVVYSYARLTYSVAERFENEPEWMTGLRAKLGSILDEKLESMSGE